MHVSVSLLYINDFTSGNLWLCRRMGLKMQDADPVTMPVCMQVSSVARLACG